MSKFIASFVAGSVIVMAVLIFYAMIITTFKQPSGAGEFGDMFGAPNALFSGLAFLGVIVAILLQKQELGLQRQELQQTREEFAGQKEQLRLQVDTLNKQTFENTFFHLLSLHHEIVNGMDRTIEVGNPFGGGATSERTSTGRDCFAEFYRCFKDSFAGGHQWSPDPKTNINEGYLHCYRKELQADVGHYFRNLYNIVKFVDLSDVQDKQFYVNLVRAQLSSDELLLLF